MTVRSKRPLSRLAGPLALFTLCTVTGARANAADGLQAATRLLFSEQSAILVLIDGDPVYRAVDGTDLQRIVNTKPFIVRDTAGIHYMKVFDGWMEAYTLTGTWSVAGVPPRGARQALRRAVAARTVDLLDRAGSRDPRGAPKLDGGAPPSSFISTEPAELITTDGPPRFAPVEGTSAEYVENTTANVFKKPTDDELYVLASGRWFRAWTSDGPWQFVPGGELPADIAAIPDKSPIWHGTHAAGLPSGRRAR